MAAYAMAATPPSTGDRRHAKFWHIPQYPQHQHPYATCTSPSPAPWVEAPLTPQDSQASAYSPRQSPRTLLVHVTDENALCISTPRLAGRAPLASPTLDRDLAHDLDLDSDVLIHTPSNGNAARRTLIRRSQPTLVTIGPKPTTTNTMDRAQQPPSTESTDNKRDHRMQQWLSEIPAPVTPQERYIQGLNPAVDHPLHPHPLPAVARQKRYLSSTELSVSDDDQLSAECEKLAVCDSDKENAAIRERLSRLHCSDKDPASVPTVSKKRQNSDTSGDGAGLGTGARKRTKILDPVRRFSHRFSSSLALNSLADFERRDGSPSEDLSPEDLRRQSDQLYKFSKLRRSSAAPSRLSVSRHSINSISGAPRSRGSIGGSGASSLRRMMGSRLTLPMLTTLPTTPPEREGGYASWHEGTPDMIINVAFVGDARVGKSALIRRLVHGTFPQSYAPSSLQEQTIRLMVGDARVQLNLSEGGSGRDAGAPSILALGWFSVVVLCYDIGNQATLASLAKHRNDIAMYEENPVVVLAGLKKDARHRLPPLQLSFVEETAQVDAPLAADVAQRMGCSAFHECSSLAGCEGVDELFDEIVTAGVARQVARHKTMGKLRFERSVDKGMAKIAEGVRSLFTFRGR